MFLELSMVRVPVWSTLPQSHAEATRQDSWTVQIAEISAPPAALTAGMLVSSVNFNSVSLPPLDHRPYSSIPTALSITPLYHGPIKHYSPIALFPPHCNDTYLNVPYTLQLLLRWLWLMLSLIPLWESAGLCLQSFTPPSSNIREFYINNGYNLVVSMCLLCLQGHLQHVQFL